MEKEDRSKKDSRLWPRRWSVSTGLRNVTPKPSCIGSRGSWHFSLRQVSNKSKASQDKSEAPSSQSEAEACFQKAIAVARHQSAKSLELRAATNLARLWQQQGKQKEAHEVLAEIYGWFTEGFDTKDLQEAKALLKELA
jgi:hypothetical protein